MMQASSVLTPVRRFAKATSMAAIVLLTPLVAVADTPRDWVGEFPVTDFEQRSIEYDEIVTDGPRRDQIPPIDNPKFIPVGEATGIGDFEPVLSIGIEGDFRAYPLRILLFHEIVNDVVGGVPVLISYCPLCNSGVVFDRRLNGEVIEFGNTGRIRHFDMVMYDKATESWWQQFLGEAIMGSATGDRMKVLPARLESLEKFRARAPQGKLLVPNDERARPYGRTPYVRMDSSSLPRRRFGFDLPKDIEPVTRVVIVGEQAWTLDILREQGPIEQDGLIITWEAGQNSIHDTGKIASGRDVGNVIVQRRTDNGLEDVPYDVSFAFAFSAFVPDGELHY
ncbi:MAG: DUF3179 domain-containing protein [Alphaproteobacteria bacterium]